MDSYDLFGEDVGGSMLDGLADLGSENFDPTPQAVARDGGGTGTGGYHPQPSYPHQMHQGEMHQESPLQKLASFGGDFSSSNHMQNDPAAQNMFHQATNHRGMCPTNTTASSYGRSMMPQQHDMRRTTGSGAQYGHYGAPPDNMYSMDQSQGMTDTSMQAWSSGHSYPNPMRHYNQMTQSAYRQQHMYPQENSMTNQQKLGQAQYGAGQQGMMASMMSSHQNMPAANSGYQRQQQPQQQQQQCYPMYPGSGAYSG